MGQSGPHDEVNQRDIVDQFERWESGKSRYLWRRRMETVIPHLPASGRVLDAGCGDLSGIQLMRAERPDLEYWACDLRPLPPGPRIVRADCQALPFAGERFDAVLMLAVLEHVPDQHTAIAEAYRVLRSNGLLLVTTPNPLYGLPMAIAGRIGLKYPERYDNGVSLERLSEMAGRAGFATLQATGFLALPFSSPLSLLEARLGRRPLARKLLLNQFLKAKKG